MSLTANLSAQATRQRVAMKMDAVEVTYARRAARGWRIWWAPAASSPATSIRDAWPLMNAISRALDESCKGE